MYSFKFEIQNSSMKKTTSSATTKSQQLAAQYPPGDINLLTMYSQLTAPEIFDLRCEYEVPRYLDLNNLEEDDENNTLIPISSMNSSSQYFL